MYKKKNTHTETNTLAFFFLKTRIFYFHQRVCYLLEKSEVVTRAEKMLNYCI